MSLEELRDLTEGETIVFSTGEYSDYNIEGTFRVLQTFSPKTIVEKFVEENPIEKNRGIRTHALTFRESQFVGWLVKNKIIEPTPCVEWHLDYEGGELTTYGDVCAEYENEAEAADAIYDEAYTLAFDALADAGVPHEKAREVAQNVARCFAQP